MFLVIVYLFFDVFSIKASYLEFRWFCLSSCADSFFSVGGNDIHHYFEQRLLTSPKIKNSRMCSKQFNPFKILNLIMREKQMDSLISSLKNQHNHSTNTRAFLKATISLFKIVLTWQNTYCSSNLLTCLVILTNLIFIQFALVSCVNKLNLSDSGDVS